jgi:hypothetical protein
VLEFGLDATTPTNLAKSILRQAPTPLKNSPERIEPGISISRRALASLLIPQSIFLNRQYTWVLRSIGKSNDEIKILHDHHGF